MFERNELVALIHEMYPRRAFLTVNEAADLMGVSGKTIKDAIERKHNPLPARNILKGTKNKSYIIPITAIADWGSGKR